MPAAAGVGVTASLLTALLPPLLLLGVSGGAWSQAETPPDFSRCRNSFYRGTPPQGPPDASDQELVQRCHSLPGGKRFASLYNSTCGVSVYTAYCLSQRDESGEHQTDGQVEDDVERPPDSRVLVPALLSGGVTTSEGRGTDAANPSLSAWDALVSGLVREAGVPQCAGAATGGADVFVLSGAAGLSQGEDGGCQAETLWSAVCCASSAEEEEQGGGGEGRAGFSVGVVKGRGEEERVVSMQELGEVLGGSALFTGFCGEVESSGDVVEIFLEKLEALKKDAASTDPESEAGISADAEEVMSSAQREAPSDDAAQPQEALEGENDTQSSGSLAGAALMYLLSSSVSLLSTPFRPVVSTLSALPGQVTYVLEEDIAVLSSIPSGTLALVQNMVCDLWGGACSAVGMVTGTCELCLSTIYSCSAPLVGSLYGACYNGVAGVGLLTADGVGIFAGVLDNTWSLSWFLGETAWDYGGGYVGSVTSELGHQAKTVGMGVGKLLWRMTRGLGNVAGVAGSVAGGTVGLVMENVKEALGEE